MWLTIVNNLLYVIFLIIHLEAKLPLVFPPTAPTRTQWIVGIGIPLEDLRFDSVTTGYVLKAEYFLPETVKQLKHPTITSISGRDFHNNSTRFGNNLSLLDSNQNLKPLSSSYRWSVYKILEVIANRMHLNGRICVLKSICELSTSPFHYENGLFGELLHILFKPASSSDTLSDIGDKEYVQAEHHGARGGDCHSLYTLCPKSLLELFTHIH